MRNRVTKTLLNATLHNIKIVFIHFYYDEHIKTLHLIGLKLCQVG